MPIPLSNKEFAVPSLDRDGNVFILSLGDDENRFNPDWVSAVNGLLDEVAAAEMPRAMVMTASGKFFSNGLDLEWFAANIERVPAFLPEIHELFARTLESPVPTVAAIQGHCFAAGAMLAVACDQRVMRVDRGYFCFPEVDIRIPFTPGMDALIKSRLPQPTAHQAMTTGRRYGGEEALAAGIVDAAVEEERVLPEAVERAAALAEKDPATLGTIKQRLYAPALATLRDVEANKLPGFEG